MRPFSTHETETGFWVEDPDGKVLKACCLHRGPVDNAVSILNRLLTDGEPPCGSDDPTDVISEEELDA